MTEHARPRISEAASARDRRTLASGKGSVFSRKSFLEDQLVERELRHGLLQPLVLTFELFQPLRLSDRTKPLTNNGEVFVID